jgi:hypothetical protein
MNFDHGSTQEHQNLVKQFIKAVAKEFPDLMVLPYTVGMFRDYDSAERIIHAGEKGALDTVVFGNGWYLWFDGKTGHATFKKEQKDFVARIKTINGGTDHAYKLTSVEQGLNVIRKCKAFYEQRKV